MAIVIPSEGQIEILKRVLYGNAGAENLSLRLFSNNYTPVVGSVLANFTEATFTGYAAITLTSSQSGGTWAVPTNSSSLSQSTYGTTATWTATTDQTIYGWYLVGVSSNKVYAAQAFGAGKPLVGASSDQLSIIPKLQLQSI